MFKPGETSMSDWMLYHVWGIRGYRTVGIADFLKSLWPLPDGIPGKDVFRRGLCTLKPAMFQRCLANWIETLRVDAAKPTGVDQPTCVVGGKTLRRSHDAKKGLGPLHPVSVWAIEYGTTLTQVVTIVRLNSTVLARNS